MNDLQSNELFKLGSQGLERLQGLYKNSIETYIYLGKIALKARKLTEKPDKYLAERWMMSESSVRNCRNSCEALEIVFKQRPDLMQQRHTKILNLLPDLREKTTDEIIEKLEEIKDLSVSDAVTLRKEKKGEECQHEWIEKCKHCGRRK